MASATLRPAVSVQRKTGVPGTRVLLFPVGFRALNFGTCQFPVCAIDADSNRLAEGARRRP